MKKTLLSIAIITALPITAMADYTYSYVSAPARVANNGTATMASYGGPYVTATIQDDDDEHIASTSYVKGAYNSAIAAVNKVDSDFRGSLQDVYQDFQESLYIPVDEFENQGISAEVIQTLDNVTSTNQLVTGMAVKDALETQRVTIYTTWEDDSDNATTQVALSTAQ